MDCELFQHLLNELVRHGLHRLHSVATAAKRDMYLVFLRHDFNAVLWAIINIVALILGTNAAGDQYLVDYDSLDFAALLLSQCALLHLHACQLLILEAVVTTTWAVLQCTEAIVLAIGIL